MIIEPKVRGFICTTAHPEGCRQNVRRQIDYVKARPKTEGPKRVLVIGASTGYGLASRIAAAYSSDAATIGIIFDKPASGSRSASAGWYNTAAFEQFAHRDGLYAKTLNGDAFSAEMKAQTVELIKQDLGQVDLVVYSLAAPRRTMPNGTVVSSVLKTVGEPYSNKTIDLRSRQLSEITIEPASGEEIEDTIKVMGGGDWLDWMTLLHREGVLAPQAVTVAYSYIGPVLTHPMYLDGSIGQAKRDLYETAKRITAGLPGVRGYISVNKALVTQSSAAIPIVPLYFSLLYKVMKQKGLHEGCIEQMWRLLHDKLYSASPVLDPDGQLRLDDLEMLPEVQQEIERMWGTLDERGVEQLADIDGYWEDFYRMFGFAIPGVDYTADCDPAVEIESLAQ